MGQSTHLSVMIHAPWVPTNTCMVPRGPGRDLFLCHISHISYIDLPESLLREYWSYFITWALNKLLNLVSFFSSLSILPVALRGLKLDSQRPLQELLSSTTSPSNPSTP